VGPFHPVASIGGRPPLLTLYGFVLEGTQIAHKRYSRHPDAAGKKGIGQTSSDPEKHSKVKE